MTDPKPAPSDPTPAPAPAPDKAGTVIQGLHETMTTVISLVILVVAVVMLLRTFEYARSGGKDPTKAAAEKEAYDRQKDVMLYALALLGTVTGYYLGRVPAERRAQQAQETVATTQGQLRTADSRLQTAQTQLTAATGTAAAAGAQAAIAGSRLQRAADALVTAQGALAGVHQNGGDRAAGDDGLSRAREAVERGLRDAVS